MEDLARSRPGPLARAPKRALRIPCSSRSSGRRLLKKALHGRYGNHLFSWASGFGLATAHNFSFCLESFEIDLARNHVGPMHCANCPDAPNCNSVAEGVRCWKGYNEQGNQRYDPPPMNGDLTRLVTWPGGGFMQSWRYFAHAKHEVRSRLRFRPRLQLHVKAHLEVLANRTGAGMGTTAFIGVHVRRGDRARTWPSR